jgi:hypothetical protein
VRIAKALEIQQDDVGPRIVGPVLQEVVPGHIGLVADRHERRESQIQLLHVFENRESKGSALSRERDASRDRSDRRERRVQFDRRICVDDPHAVGSDHPDARRPQLAEDLLFQRASRWSRLAEAGTDDHQGLHAFHHAIVDDGADPFAGYTDDRQVDATRDVGDPWKRWNVVDRRRGRMHCVQPSREPSGGDVVQDLGPDFAALAVRADDHDCVRLEEMFHRGRGR